MKKTAFVTILSATLLFTSCSSGQTPAISALTEATEATTATTTEATTTTTMEETTTTVETAAEPEKPEDYAQLYFMNEGNLREIHATDFEFVDAELYKDPNGVLRKPNYRSGKTMEVRFKSDKDFKYIFITRYASFKDYTPESLITIDRKGNVWKSNTSKYLSCKDGIYSLKIPAKYAKPDSTFMISLSTMFPDRNDNKEYVGINMHFTIRCEKVTEIPVPTFTREEHTQINNNVGATDFDFGNAEYIVSNDRYYYSAEPPKYIAGNDIVITFKCKKELSINEVSSFDRKVNAEDYESYAGKDITKPDFVSFDGETYKVTIPAEYAKPDRCFFIMLSETTQTQTDQTKTNKLPTKKPQRKPQTLSFLVST